MVRLAEYHDMDTILWLFSEAREIMRADGNTEQWKGPYPGEEQVRDDLERGVGRVVLHGDEVVAYFAIIPSPEPTYARIVGEWLDDVLPYVVIHRIASSRASRGVFKEIIEYASTQCGNIRIDTHRDNRIMQHVITKAGFKYCGIIYLADGAERLAYQKIAER